MGIELTGLCVSLGGTRVLSDFSLSLPDTGFVCLLGPSGSGKTTLLRLLAGLLEPDAGTMAGLDGRRRSMVFQEDRLLPWCTALQNAALPRSALGEARAVLAALGLGDDAMAKKPAELSGGMCRRVALARALCFGGDLYLLDEPLKGMDALLKERIIRELRQRTKGALVLMVTHEREEALALADELLWFSGTPLELKKRESVPFRDNKRNIEENFDIRYKRNEE